MLITSLCVMLFSMQFASIIYGGTGVISTLLMKWLNPVLKNEESTPLQVPRTIDTTTRLGMT